ncbi:unnamed protein product [Didymodactylos carnosus]|uniref:Carboxylic ester hydrolase n=1 Tax=Didymodactylos carnosus TaxID=1234261 RepID=A0A814SXB6_9BILA|nr:unnamed protein product [Didymodactylos carnosus]CAF3917587.1 unnamed protein product [Didymodactylos carnosus]
MGNICDVALVFCFKKSKINLLQIKDFFTIAYGPFGMIFNNQLFSSINKFRFCVGGLHKVNSVKSMVEQLKFLILLFVSSTVNSIQQTEIINTTTNGYIQGFSNEYAEVFLGIPYAKAPTGALRFQVPQAYKNENKQNNTVFQAIEPGDGCIQECTLPTGACPKTMSEDCLSLNIYRPRRKSGQALTVMIFIHGGNFLSGASAVPAYDASHLVNLTNVIVVTINYRLGAFGFYWNNGLPGNVGLLDQQLAMKWVQYNINSFGGNPSNVVLFGQSAGATSISCHLQNLVVNKVPQPPLFHKVIMESFPIGIPLRSTESAASFNNAFAAFAGCLFDVTLCLQTKTPAEILKAQNLAQDSNVVLETNKLLAIGQPWEPTLNLPTFLLTNNHPEFFVQNSNPINIPILLGTTYDEGTLFIYDAQRQTIKYTDLLAYIGALWNVENVIPINLQYKINFALADYHDVLSQILADSVFTCAARYIAQSLSLHNSNLYLYVFNYLSNYNTEVLAYGNSSFKPQCYTKVCHGSELPLVFNSDFVLPYKLTEEEEGLSQLIGRYFTNFAKTGNPNSELSVGDEKWPVFQNITKQNILLTLPKSITASNYRGAICDFWNKLGYD